MTALSYASPYSIIPSPPSLFLSGLDWWEHAVMMPLIGTSRAFLTIGQKEKMLPNTGPKKYTYLNGHPKYVTKNY